MKPVRFPLPPMVEAGVQRADVGEGQPEYIVIPTVITQDADFGGMLGFLSKWVLEDSEVTAVAREKIRGYLILFLEWITEQPHLANGIVSDDPAFVDGIVADFLKEHPDLNGDPAAIFYTQLIVIPKHGQRALFQPVRFHVQNEPPLMVGVDDPTGKESQIVKATARDILKINDHRVQ